MRPIPWGSGPEDPDHRGTWVTLGLVLWAALIAAGIYCGS